MKKIFSYTVIVILFTGVIAAFNLSCKNGDNNDDNPDPTAIPQTNNPDPEILSHSIINAYPHDTSSFTEGLEFYKGELYEGTGNYGESRLMRVDVITGKPLKQIALDKKYFGEGITILNDTIYQLTYKENTVFAYNLKDFKKIKEYSFTTDSKEGWGMTNDGKNLIATDGGNNLYFFQSSTFTLLRKLGVTEGSNPVFNLNEVEYIDGYIYANQWQYPYILKIDPATGKVVAKYDLNDMWNRVKTIKPNVDVPNGIAYNEATKKLYVTGKLWPELYEIQLGQ